MRHTRMIGILLVTFLALAGGAFAVGVGVTANHSASVAGHEVATHASTTASDSGATGALGLDAGVAKLDGAAMGTLPALPAAPALPSMPTLPATPNVSGSASATGSASAAAGDASGDGAAKLTMG